MDEMDVVRAYERELEQLCRRYAKGVEAEKRRAVACENMVLAIRTWDKRLCDFHSYMQVYVARALKETRREANRIKRQERLSLEAPVDPETPAFTFAELFHPTYQFENSVDFHDLMREIQETDQRLCAVAWMLADDYTPEEICKAQRLDPDELEWYRYLLREAVEAYNAQWLEIA